nr:cytochrome b5 reductase 4-like isoform X1 [Dermacentor andersoni]XP_054922407.1 cytochrome b5 reductase 4-like isoform X1 [Dermacentor andersoni]XP_054922408.1 cytochrome b5 reductase 4-like isoform X1 [Dermacentor andersoni]
MNISANSLAPGEPNMSATGSGRVKVSLGPGRSLMDWIRLTHANPNLSGVNGRFLEITYEELVKHNKKDDAWICLKGRVYNVTPYMEYHPGGVDELLRGVGTDATDLFNQVHKWVNFESMLEKCLIGKLVGPAIQVRKSSFPVPRIPFIKKLQRTDTATSEDVPDISQETSPKPAVSLKGSSNSSHQSCGMYYLVLKGIISRISSCKKYFNALNTSGVVGNQRLHFSPSAMLPLFLPRCAWLWRGGSLPPVLSPCYEWFQDDSTVTITIQSMGDAFIEEDKVVADLSGKTLRIRIRMAKYFYLFHVELQDNVYSSYNVQVKCKLKCLETQLVKERNCVSWSSLGSFLSNHNQLVPLKNSESFSRSCTLVNKDSVTHDITLFSFMLPQGSYMWVPIGHHVTLEHDVKGMRISRSYTPVIPALEAEEAGSDGKTVHLMIKVYSEGALTPVLNTLEIGDKVDMKDTEGDFELSTLERCQNLILLAAGTGFTPMVRLLHWGLFVSKQINIKLMTFNKTVRDIIWKEELDRLQEGHNRLHVEHVLSEPDDSWEGARGRVRSELLERLLPEDIRQSDSLLVCICGPLPFTKAALKCLEDLQCPSKSVHAFLG